MGMEKVVHRIATYPSFATAFREDPSAAIQARGMELSLEEINAILTGMDSDLISGVNTGPTDGFVSQFADTSAGPEWFVSQFSDTNVGPEWFVSQFPDTDAGPEWFVSQFADENAS